MFGYLMTMNLILIILILVKITIITIKGTTEIIIIQIKQTMEINQFVGVIEEEQGIHDQLAIIVE